MFNQLPSCKILITCIESLVSWFYSVLFILSLPFWNLSVSTLLSQLNLNYSTNAHQLLSTWSTGNCWVLLHKLHKVILLWYGLLCYPWQHAFIDMPLTSHKCTLRSIHIIIPACPNLALVLTYPPYHTFLCIKFMALIIFFSLVLKQEMNWAAWVLYAI